MKKILFSRNVYIRSSMSFLSVFFISFAFFSFAADTDINPPTLNSSTGANPPTLNSSTGANPPTLNSDTDSDGCSQNTLCNPLKADSIIQFLIQIIDVLLTFALPIIVLYIMYGGFLLVTAQGKPTELEKGRNAILWSVIGGVIVLGAKLIISVIQTTVASLGA